MKLSDKSTLILIKSLHTVIWLFFNFIIFYLLYAVIVNKIDKWIWIGLGFIAIETIILVLFKNICPVTLVARKYSDSSKENFDIFLPVWLARYNKEIYTSLVVVVLIILFYRLVN